MKKNVIHLLLFFPFFVLSQEVCNDYYACNYAYEGDCQYPEEYYDCNNNCLNDVDNDNVCDELEIFGCTDGNNVDGTPMACNYNPNATENDGSCVYPGIIFDCDGATCLNDVDGDGICDENEVFGCNDPDAYNFEISATEDNGTCWYPVFGCLDPLAGNYNPFAEIDDSSCLFSPWEFNSTDCNMTILIPDNANLLIDEYNLEFGDWIGAFYEDENNNLLCGGSVMWKGETTSIAIWGAESGLDNGFQENEEIIWKVFQNESEDTLIPNYIFGSNFYNCNGLGGLAELSVFNQEIYFPAGWTIFSSHIIPIENDIEKIFSGVSDLIIVKDQNGDVFWPTLGINQIGPISYDEGYIVKMNYESNGTNILFTGSSVDPETEFNINEGWSIISYLNKESASVEYLMEEIEENLIIIKDEDGLIYWPQFGVNSMNNMHPGRGYQIKLNSPTEFSYSPTSYSRFVNPDFANQRVHYSKIQKTGQNMTLGIPISSWGYLPNIGDEIGIFTSAGNLIGSTVFNGQSIAISIWGDDETTLEKDGIFSGEKFILKLWDSDLNCEKNLVIGDWIEGGDIYYSNSISVVNSISIFNDELISYEILKKFDLMGSLIKGDEKNKIIFSQFENGKVSKEIKFD